MPNVLKVAWMYHDFMDLYGDKGNMMVLKKRCEDRGIAFQLDAIGIGDEADLSEYNIVFMGGGADKEQMTLIPDLQERKENILEALEAKTFFFLICGGYQLFGQYYIATDGTKVDGLSICDYYTETGDDGMRCVGNIVIDAILDDLHTQVIGFENHGGQTQNVAHPFGTVIKGCGNSFQAGQEGYYDGRILGTYLHGPILPKNPEVADFVIMKGLQKDNPEFKWNDLTPLADTFESKARETLLKRWDIKKD